MLKRFEDALNACTYCPNLCLHSCVVSNAEKKSSVTPWGKMSLLQWVKEGIAPLNEETTEILYKCTGCGACTASCVHEIPVATVLMEGRQEALKRGLGGPRKQERSISQTRLDSVRVRGGRGSLKGKVVYWPGCQKGLDDEETRVATQAVLKALTGREVVLGPSACCGAVEVSNGRPEAARNEALGLGAILGEAEMVFAGSGLCQHHLLSNRVHVESLIPFVLKSLLAEPERLNGLHPGPVAIFESCSHLRKLKISDQVVALASRLVDGGVQELRWCGNKSQCCGAGGGYAQSSPEGARQGGRRILEMAADTGAEILTSFDSECVAHLKECTWDGGPTVISGMALLANLMNLQD